MIECPCLGTLSRVRIGHDNKGGSAGWFLDKVIAFEAISYPRQLYFKYKQSATDKNQSLEVVYVWLD